MTYNQSCNLSCDFCYVNFHHKKIQDKTYEIIKKAILLNFDVITFGGGDAFSKKSFRNSCILAKENNLFTQVDTNGIAIRLNDHDFIDKYVDLIGISLDSIGEEYNEFRKSKKLFTKVNSVLKTLDKNNINTKLKINTILTKQNKNAIYDIYNYLKSFNSIERWSIYQFFPLSAAKRKRETFEISNEGFDETLFFLNDEKPNFKIEKFKFSDRVSGYIFCDEEGILYTNSLEGNYIVICSIFDTEAEKKLLNLHELINPKTENRYS
ncbi:radical SAM protein [Halobacillus naozhouensis]|uniref:Radical SAM protein n=1 Tax=Halobacillus naozhouensis TaxID=554880 RepID=A0ABY8J3N5_9BACI|nr:radical SAM protein [Halobacillus naozhouensis]WFT76204.1 radical SAM protein [Halobacillus naozhouensis]